MTMAKELVLACAACNATATFADWDAAFKAGWDDLGAMGHTCPRCPSAPVVMGLSAEKPVPGRVYFITADGLRVDAHWNSFQTERRAREFFGGDMMRLKGVRYGLSVSESREVASLEPVPDERQAELFWKAMRRPANFAALSPEEQWAIDKALGCLDWDGGCGHLPGGLGGGCGRMCSACRAKFERRFKG
jgi:hypothetical protein